VPHHSIRHLKTIGAGRVPLVPANGWSAATRPVG